APVEAEQPERDGESEDGGDEEDERQLAGEGKLHCAFLARLGDIVEVVEHRFLQEEGGTWSSHWPVGAWTLPMPALLVFRWPTSSSSAGGSTSCSVKRRRPRWSAPRRARRISWP